MKTITFEGQQHSFPDDFTDDDISKALSSVPQPDVATDVAKSAGVGLGKGVLGLAGIGGTARDINAAAVSGLAGLAGYDLPAEKVSSVLRFVPGMMGPSPAQLQRHVEPLTGKFYEPQTTAGEYAQTVGEFAPAAATGPGGIARRAVSTVVPAITSESGGQAFKGTPFETPARVVGGLAGGYASAPRAASAKLTPAQIEARATAGYQSPEVTGLIFRQQAADDLVNAIKASLRRGKANERLAPATNALVDDLRVPVAGRHTYEDLQTTRELLGKQAANFANPQEQRAASVALEKLTAYIDNIPQGDLIAGNAAAASAKIARARADYAAAKTAERVAEKVYAAELQAGSAHSGGNLQNALRQQQKKLLTQKGRRGLTEAELAQVEEGVTGSLPANLLRAGGKLLAGGGGMGSVVSGYVGHSALGPFGAAAPAVGYGIKRVGDVLAQRKADALVQSILQRAPSAQRQTRTNIRTHDPRGRIAQLLGVEAALEQRRR